MAQATRWVFGNGSGSSLVIGLGRVLGSAVGLGVVLFLGAQPWAAQAEVPTAGGCGPSALGAPCPQEGPASLPQYQGAPLGLGNPVHLGTGYKYQRDTDFQQGGSLGLEVVRHYNSADPRDVGLGPGWRLSYDTRLYVVGDIWQIVQADGVRWRFAAPQAPGEACQILDGDSSTPGELWPQTDGSFRWHWPTGRVLVFDQQGWLQSIEEPGGAYLKLLWGRLPGQAGFQRLLGVRAADGRQLRFEYAQGRLQRALTPLGVLHYVHTPSGSLRAVLNPGGQGRLYVYEPAAQGVTQEKSQDSGKGALQGNDKLVGQGPATQRLTGVFAWQQAWLRRLWSWDYNADGQVVKVSRGERSRVPRILLHYGSGASDARLRPVMLEAEGKRWPLLSAFSKAEINDVASTPQEDLNAVAATFREELNAVAGNSGMGSTVPAAEREPLQALRAVPSVDSLPSWPGLQWRSRDGALKWRADEVGSQRWQKEGPLDAASPIDASGLEDLEASSGFDGLDSLDPLRGLEGRWRWEFANGDRWRLEFDEHGRLRAWRRWSARLQRGDDVVLSYPKVIGRNETRLTVSHPWETRHYRQEKLRPELHPAPGFNLEPSSDPTPASRPKLDSNPRFNSKPSLGLVVDSEPVAELDAVTQQWAERVDTVQVQRAAMGAMPAWQYEERLWRNARGQVVRHDLPEGGQLIYLHDGLGQLQEITWLSLQGVKRSLWQRQARGWRLANGTQVQSGQNAQPGLADNWLWHVMGARPVLAHYRQTNEHGLVVEEAVRVAGGAPYWQRLHYDAQARLVGWQNETQWRAWAWSASGALRSQVQGDATSSVEVEIRPIPRDRSGLPQQWQGWQLEYGPDRRLARASKGGMQVRYFYNALGELIGRVAPGQATQYLYQGHQRVAEWQPGANRQGRIERRFVYAGEVPVALLQRNSSSVPVHRDYLASSRFENRRFESSNFESSRFESTRFESTRFDSKRFQGRDVEANSFEEDRFDVWTVHADAMGQPLALSDETGRLRWQAEFDVWGRQQGPTRGEGDPGWRWPGQWRDPLLGWHLNHQRIYLPERGQYLEPELLGPAVVPPAQGLASSPFGYAAQQPRRWLDPTGLVLFAFDGTLQDQEHEGNVVRFLQRYRDTQAQQRGLPQGYYQSGPGSESWGDAAFAYSAAQRVQEHWQSLLQHVMALGAGADPVLIDLVGYSRGAAMARDFANRLAAEVRQGRFWTWDNQLGAITHCVDLRFMGLFDSVAQFGVLGSANEGFDFTLDPAWQWVAHAVALHERRQWFPLLSLVEPGAGLAPNAIEQGFIGSHADIGGGMAGANLQKGEAVLSDVTLAWMLEQAQRIGVMVEQDAGTREWASDERAGGDWAWLHDERTPYQRLQGWQYDQAAGKPTPGVYPSDRAVLDAGGQTWLAYQGLHDTWGKNARLSSEALLQRTVDWLWAPGRRVAQVDLAAYERWRAERGY